jgi:DHA1 family multidrug resistance protein-like MFS transporter
MALRRLFQKVFDPSLPGVYYELIFIGFSIMMGMSLSSSFLPILADRLDPQGVLVGMVVSAWYLSRMFIELPAGIISDRVGRRKLMVTGLGLSLVGPVLCSQASHIYILIIGRGVWGMGTTLYFMMNMALLMDILPGTTRGRALGLFQGIEFIGSFVGAPLGAWLATIISFTQVFYITTLFTAVSFIVAFKSRGMRVTEETSPIRSSMKLGEVSASLRNQNVLILCLCNLFRMLMRQGIDQTVLLLYLNKVQELGVAHIGWVVSMKIAGMVIFLLIAGVVSDMYGRKPVLIPSAIHSGKQPTPSTALRIHRRHR